MSNDFYSGIYNPDVLSCLANLSNDEVFTPPEVANQMLDMLPQELFLDPNTKFLDPACKSGVFLREIAKRLIVGLEPVFPDLEERLEHIFKNQVYGIAITELTSLLSRRGTYCSKYPNSMYSVVPFDNAQGNIRFKMTPHRWKDGKCVFCGANKELYDRNETLEMHAYEFIHTTKPQEMLKMKFDVIVGNPPYQLNVGSGGKGSGTAIPIYNKFVEQAIKLNPRYLTMIIPARWYSGGRGLENFRNSMLNDYRIENLVDFFDSKECFPGVDIAGGVCYFLWNRERSKSESLCLVENHFNGKTISESRKLNEHSIFIRNNYAIDIVGKVMNSTVKTMNSIVRPVSLFGLNTNHKFSSVGDVRVKFSGGFANCKESELKAGHEILNKYKVYISAASYDHAGQPDKEGKRRILSIVDILEPREVCTSTYIVVDAFTDKKQAENLVKYLKTKFIRFLLSQVCISQHISRDTFMFVPELDFNKLWTDEDLYKLYNITDDEIDFIEAMIKPME